MITSFTLLEILIITLQVPDSEIVRDFVKIYEINISCYTGQFTRRRTRTNNYKQYNNIPAKTTLGNTTYVLCNTDPVTACPFRDISATAAIPPAMREGSIVSDCVCRRQETNFSIFCNPITSTSIKVCTQQPSFSFIHYIRGFLRANHPVHLHDRANIIQTRVLVVFANLWRAY
jgi:hypothetical protein